MGRGQLKYRKRGGGGAGRGGDAPGRWSLGRDAASNERALGQSEQRVVCRIQQVYALVLLRVLLYCCRLDCGTGVALLPLLYATTVVLVLCILSYGLYDKGKVQRQTAVLNLLARCLSHTSCRSSLECHSIVLRIRRDSRITTLSQKRLLYQYLVPGTWYVKLGAGSQVAHH